MLFEVDLVKRHKLKLEDLKVNLWVLFKNYFHDYSNSDTRRLRLGRINEIRCVFNAGKDVLLKFDVSYLIEPASKIQECSKLEVTYNASFLCELKYLYQANDDDIVYHLLHPVSEERRYN